MYSTGRWDTGGIKVHKVEHGWSMGVAKVGHKVEHFVLNRWAKVNNDK